MTLLRSYMLQGMAGVLGEVPLAAHVMLQSLNQFTFPFSMSVGKQPRYPCRLGCILLKMAAISLCTGTAATTRVGNLLGGNDGAQARLVLHLALSIAFVINIVLSSLIYTQRDRVGHIYSSDERAIAAAAEVMGTYVRQPRPCRRLRMRQPEVAAGQAIFQAFNGCNQTLRGVMAGCGRQILNAKVSLGCVWLIVSRTTL